ncbi:hypothetical protein SLS60_009581 [Paraconiothyrium brasiliense]|uniref:Uncharacterized protein n=1 Tax=Paraconiothyrium brasiliense TaxID=300254 RepID=A0ABR3QUS4_9PLEO
MEYSHIGTLKLGTLRIANGEPSPAASAKLNWYASQATSQGEDYFSDALDSPIMMKSTRKRRHVRSKSALQPPTPPLYRNLRVSDDVRKAKTTSRYGTPPKPESPKQSRQQHHNRSQPLIPPDEELDMEPEPLRRLRVMNKSQDTLATLATMLEAQTSITEDLSTLPQLVAADDLDEGFASDEGGSYREEAIRILDGTIFSEPAEAFNRREVVAPHPQSTPKQQRIIETRPPPQKADSGYSSGGSFKAKHREADSPGTIPTVSKKPSMVTDLRQSENGAEKNDVTSLYTFEQMLQASTSQDSLPPAPRNQHMIPHTMNRYRSQEDIKETALPLDWHIDDLSLGAKAPRTPSTPTSFVSHFSLDSKTSMQKRLQKRKPSFQELPVVQSCDPIPEGSIPSIPADVRKQFVRRLSEAPGMDYLTHTYPTKNHVNIDEPEPEPELPALEPIKFPSPPSTPEPESRGRDRKRPDTERSSSLSGLRRSLSLFRRKTKESKEEEQPPLPDEPTLLHIGTTAASLGRSPYDIALATTPQKRIASPTHPYQLGNAMPRAKSMVNMDAQTAAKLARLRSKDRASMRPGMPARPKSYYSEKEAMGDADIYRRHSFYGRAPPMPTIPSIGELAAANRQHEQQPQMQPEMPEVPAVQQPTPANSGRKIRARSTNRGRVVSPLIEKYDTYSQHPNDVGRQSRSRTMGNDVTYHTALQDSRAYSMGSEAVTRRHNKVNHPDWG